MLTPKQKEKVLEYIKKAPSGGFTFRDVVRFLGLASDDRRSLQRHLDELDSEGVIRRIKRGRYALPARETLVAGTLHCHRDGYGFLIPEDRSRHKEDIFIPGRNMKGALQGDRVLARIEKRKTPSRRVHRSRHVIPEKQRIEGTVARIVERKHPRIVGRYCDHPRYPYVIPLDSRIFHDIRIPPHLNRNAVEGQIVSVDIIQPPGPNQPAQGRVRAVLGDDGDPGIEYLIVEHKYGLPTEFSREAIRESESLPDHVLEEEYRGREDLRDEMTVTIDGETARDFDDAVSLRKLPSERYLLGVHIADVSHYVVENSSIDRDAYLRGTSVYFPDRAIPMLPEKLSNGICSLRPHVDRLVLSVFMEIDRKGQVQHSRFARGVLRSRERMTYKSLALILIDKDPETVRRYAD
ncbi:MAG: RNB domain-containing ribonuclease, partial [Acidobacteriota bacterium]